MKKNNSFIAAHSTMMEMTTNISITLTYSDTEITREVSREPSPPTKTKNNSTLSKYIMEAKEKME
jgi:hypothetical protein